MEEILIETEAYMPPPAQEMPFSTASLKESVQNVLRIAPATILLPVVTPLVKRTFPENLQLLYLEPGEVKSTFTLPPVKPPSPPPLPVLLVPLLLLPPPPPPPH